MIRSPLPLGVLLGLMSLAACNGDKENNGDGGNTDSGTTDGGTTDGGTTDGGTTDGGTTDGGTSDTGSTTDGGSDGGGDGGTEDDLDGDGWTTADGDCDDDNNDAFPGNPERCDDVDQDCDESIDEDAADATNWYNDTDGDGYGDATTGTLSCDAPTGTVADSSDCDDTDALFNPGAVEDDCNDPNDYNCDGSTGYADADADGAAACEDCDDSDATSYPGGTEVCDGVDQDCDGLIDDDADDSLSWYTDADADGFGDPTSERLSCEADASEVADATDCDDTDPAVFPGAIEVCGGVDDDCDALVDGDDPDLSDALTWYLDADGDNYGDSSTSAEACDAPEGFVAADGDCDDSDAAYYPGATEDDCADPSDYNCDGSVGYVDGDGDGFAACEECDDGDASINPDGIETCNEADDDCDGETDEADAADAATWYSDTDNDGYGDADSTDVACSAPEGTVDDASDCDDTDAETNPGAAEVCGGSDEDCDGLVDDLDPDVTETSTWYSDTDTDGYGDPASTMESCEADDGYVAPADDCDDTDPAYNPGADESDCTDPADYNCDGSTGYVDDDGDGYAACEDCDDTDAAVHPDAAETCNGIDDDCDGSIDPDDAVDAATWYSDLDADGYGDGADTTLACDAPTGFVADDTDCDDTDDSIHPSADEYCGGTDYDCDGAADESTSLDAATWYSDGDGDSYGDPADTVSSCLAPTGFVEDDTDCDDRDNSVNPAATETCNTVDDDCDGTTDEDDASDATSWYNDTDGDGYGDSDDTGELSCAAPDDTVADNTDCDDSNAAISPSATESCNEVDDDCDGGVDETGATGEPTWYRDADRDGYGTGDTTAMSCSAPAGYTTTSTDCDDTKAAVYPGAIETCNTIDDDCDGTTDESDASDATTWYADTDGDTYGDADSSIPACATPVGYTADSSDCDDSESAVSPAGTETCNEVDDDCDGTTDENSATDATTWYSDTDGDGFGDSDDGGELSCDAPTATVANRTDCDDSDADINPAATEACNETDDDCDGSVDEAGATGEPTWYRDADDDGFGTSDTTAMSCSAPAGYTTTSTDCDDTKAAVYPGATETCNSTDDDCDGTTDESDASDAPTWYADLDLDGYGDAADSTRACSSPADHVEDATDCDDTNGDTNPAATETCNEVDDDCDGTTDESDASDATTWYSDTDADGFGDSADGGELSCDAPTATVANKTDCDDSNADINPTATESCNEADDDCDGSVDEAGATGEPTWYRDADDDGFGTSATSKMSCSSPDGYTSTSTDCDDTTSAVYPGATESCNTIDDNCDGTIDEDDAVDATTWFADLDLDGYGDASSSTVACTSPADHVNNASDCDDTNSDTSPSATETCNELDDDCDGTTDESDASDALTWYVDTDGDGYGDSSDSGEPSCNPPSATVADNTDCDDANFAVNPGEDEVCDPADDDEDCNGSADDSDAGVVESTLSRWYNDADGDGYGDATVYFDSCDALSGTVDDDTDCDDTDATIYPSSSTEDVPQDGIDQDCDGLDPAYTMADLLEGDLVITEFMQNPLLVSDALGEYFEFINLSGGTVDLDGLYVYDEGTDKFTVRGELLIEDGEYVVFAITGNPATNGGVTEDYAWSTGFALGNSDDEIYLADSSLKSVIFDVVRYDGGPNFPDPNGYSASLDPDFIDHELNDDGSVWCTASSTYGTGDRGTPGSINDSCP
jgi:large repetitive protein